jgi:hypothetical protein
MPPRWTNNSIADTNCRHPSQAGVLSFGIASVPGRGSACGTCWTRLAWPPPRSRRRSRTRSTTVHQPVRGRGESSSRGPYPRNLDTGFDYAACGSVAAWPVS